MLRQYRLFFALILIFILSGLIIILALPKGEAILRLNGLEVSMLDPFFSQITKLGEWLGGLIIGLLLLIAKPPKYLFMLLLAIGIAASSAQLLKTQVFSQSNRPSSEYGEQIRQIQGIELHKNYSFPSGHTTAAFCMFSVLAFSMRKKSWQIVSAVLACLVGVSRMYLGQHYLMDVVAGACLGSFIGAMVFWGLEAKWSSPWSNKRLFKAR